MLLGQAVEGFLLFKALGCSRNTLNDYRNTLRQWLAFGGDVEVLSVTADDVRRFLYFLREEQGRAPKTVKNALTGISSFYTWAERELGAVHVVREGKVALPTYHAPEIQPLTQAEVKALLVALQRSAEYKTQRRSTATALRNTRVRDVAMVLVMVDTGLRVQEVCDLTVGDVNLEAGSVLVQHGKGDKERMVYIGQATKEALWRYLAGRKDRRAEQALFETHQRGPLDRHTVRKLLEKAGERAGVAGSVHPHRLRHTFAINYLRNGGDIFTLQRLLGHSSLDMVRRYLAIASVDLADSHRRASPVDNWRL